MRPLAPLLAIQTVASASKFQYSIEKVGLFLQEDAKINANPPSYASNPDFGLLSRIYDTDTAFDPSGKRTQWERFTRYVQSLNDGSGPDTHYKVLYMARHGEAAHNIAQTYYSAECWECYWSQQPGNGSATWLDAELTPKGHSQVATAHDFWSKALAEAKIPTPQSFYVSPMARTLSTANETWSTQSIWDNGQQFAPTVKELLRETINACTCSWRHPKTWIAQRFPSYKFEPGFTEDDSLWHAGVITEGQSSPAQLHRVQQLLDDVFSTDANTFISFTTHGVVINPILQVIGYPNPSFNLTTGQAIPVLVKARRVEDGSAGSQGEIEPPYPAKTCGSC